LETILERQMGEKKNLQQKQEGILKNLIAENGKQFSEEVLTLIMDGKGSSFLVSTLSVTYFCCL
jgi:hypothetical protein